MLRGTIYGTLCSALAAWAGCSGKDGPGVETYMGNKFGTLGRGLAAWAGCCSVDVLGLRPTRGCKALRVRQEARHHMVLRHRGRMSIC